MNLKSYFGAIGTLKFGLVLTLLISLKAFCAETSIFDNIYESCHCNGKGQFVFVVPWQEIVDHYDIISTTQTLPTAIKYNKTDTFYKIGNE